MRIVELRWRRYRIPFRRPVATAHGAMTAREGAIVEVVSDEGITGVGEIAPLPQFGQTLEEALAPLPELARSVGARSSGCDHLMVELLLREDLPAATRFGLETALRDARTRDARTKASAETFGPARRAVPVNASVAVVDPDQAAAGAYLALRQGFTVVKLKVGVCATLDEEVKRVEVVRRAVPDALLRLDANEAWTFDQAIDVLSRVGSERIEYCEQPLPRADLDGMRRLREEAPVAIAADEAVTDLESVRRVAAARAADVIILKPQCVGGAAACESVVRRFAWGMRWVVTSAMEAGIGVNASLLIAEALRAVPSLPPAGLACGLATLDLLEDDMVLEAPRIENGVMYVPQGPGLGVELDRAALAKYAVD